MHINVVVALSSLNILHAPADVVSRNEWREITDVDVSWESLNYNELHSEILLNYNFLNVSFSTLFQAWHH